MKILGIETSCDETAAAVVEDGTKILSNVVASSAEMHIKSGGVVPEAAARAQVRSILPVISQALKNAGLPSENLDAIAISVGPGLIGSLLVGVETAKTLGILWNKPIVPVNHLVAHIYANFIREIQNKEPEFPALALVVSGGHTDLVLMKGHSRLEWLGGTRDDAAGEAFDKCARLLGLPYPGGPAIAAEAAKFEARNSKFELTKFPRPMIDERNFEWSFSGLKTAVLREIQNPTTKSVTLFKIQKGKLAAEIQEAIVDVLVEKTLRAVKKFRPISLLLAGGVAANSRLREKFELEIVSRKLKVEFRVPDPKLCTDNATFIASSGFFNFHPVDWRKIDSNPELTIVD